MNLKLLACALCLSFSMAHATEQRCETSDKPVATVKVDAIGNKGVLFSFALTVDANPSCPATMMFGKQTSYIRSCSKADGADGVEATSDIVFSGNTVQASLDGDAIRLNVQHVELVEIDNLKTEFCSIQLPKTKSSGIDALIPETDEKTVSGMVPVGGMKVNGEDVQIRAAVQRF